MPLTLADPPVIERDDGLLFWMTNKDGAWVRVLISKEVLHRKLDNNAKPLFATLAIFYEHKAAIEMAASKKFDAKTFEDLEDGNPALVLKGSDF